MQRFKSAVVPNCRVASSAGKPANAAITRSEAPNAPRKPPRPAARRVIKQAVCCQRATKIRRASNSTSGIPRRSASAASIARLGRDLRWVIAMHRREHHLLPARSASGQRPKSAPPRSNCSEPGPVHLPFPSLVRSPERRRRVSGQILRHVRESRFQLAPPARAKRFNASTSSISAVQCCCVPENAPARWPRAGAQAIPSARFCCALR